MRKEYRSRLEGLASSDELARVQAATDLQRFYDKSQSGIKCDLPFISSLIPQLAQSVQETSDQRVIDWIVYFAAEVPQDQPSAFIPHVVRAVEDPTISAVRAHHYAHHLVAYMREVPDFERHFCQLANHRGDGVGDYIALVGLGCMGQGAISEAAYRGILRQLITQHPVPRTRFSALSAMNTPKLPLQQADVAMLEALVARRGDNTEAAVHSARAMLEKSPRS